MRPGTHLNVALGDDLYEIERPFGSLLPGEGKVTDVAVDLSGRVHVLLRRDPLVEPEGPAVVVFDDEGAGWAPGARTSSTRT